MSEYRVTWTVDVEAPTAEEAARHALRMQRDPESIATVFEVMEILELADGRRKLSAVRTFDIDSSVLGDSSVEH